jgi:hypothetical protein
MWSVIEADWSNLQLWDTGVGLGVTYDYRVRASGIAGFSPYSDLATATAPSDPVDTEAPLVSITSPDGTQPVSGNVSVLADASDNVGVTYMEIEVQSPATGRDLLCSANHVTSLSCNWNTRRLDPGFYTLEALAIDALNNGSYDVVVVQVE